MSDVVRERGRGMLYGPIIGTSFIVFIFQSPIQLSFVMVCAVYKICMSYIHIMQPI